MVDNVAGCCKNQNKPLSSIKDERWENLTTPDRMGVGITLSLQGLDQGFDSRRLGRQALARHFSPLENIHTGYGDHRPSCGNWWLFPRRHGGQGVKTIHRPHLMPRMNKICLPSIWLYGMQRNVTFLLQQGIWISLWFRSFEAPYSLSRWREWPM